MDDKKNVVPKQYQVAFQSNESPRNCTYICKSLVQGNIKNFLEQTETAGCLLNMLHFITKTWHQVTNTPVKTVSNLKQKFKV